MNDFVSGNEIVASADSPEEPERRPYHRPRIVRFGSIESLPDAGQEDSPALADPRLQLIIERWKEIPEAVKTGLSDAVRKALE